LAASTRERASPANRNGTKVASYISAISGVTWKVSGALWWLGEPQAGLADRERAFVSFRRAGSAEPTWLAGDFR